MQGWYAERFERDMGCTEAELRRWLDGALPGRPLRATPQGTVATIGAGHLTLAWQALPPRQIALMCMPRLHVSFDFEHVDEALRQQVMRYFDLYTQRGGG